jgi:dTDP-4-dehydrorhamnose reductase
MRVAVVGARGQLGAAMVQECARRYDVIPFDRSMLDVTDGAAVTAAIERARPAAIINCTGYNAVDAAEEHPVDAFQVNGLAVRSLARAAAAHGCALVHYSTDFVFDGTASAPYVETDRPNPRSVYAASKLVGEWFAADVVRAYVLRVESLFGTVPGWSDKGSVSAIVSALKSGKVARVFEDRTVSPTYIFDAARATCELLDRNAAPGVYHCVNSGACTWADFAREAARLLGVEPKLQVVRVADVVLPAARPQYCALANAKLRAAGIVMPSWQDALAQYVEQKGREVGLEGRSH